MFGAIYGDVIGSYYEVHCTKDYNFELKEKYGVKYVTLDTLLKLSDVLMIHAPLTTSTYHLLDKEKIGLMKETAIIPTIVFLFSLKNSISTSPQQL